MTKNRETFLARAHIPAPAPDVVERLAQMLEGVFGPIIHCDSGDLLGWDEVARVVLTDHTTKDDLTNRCGE